MFAGGNDQLIKMMSEGTAELQATTNKTIITGLSALGLALVITLLDFRGFAWHHRTDRPSASRQRMGGSAGGDTASETPGLERKDEVGQMAAAVAIFRDNALERARLEREADEGRSLSERERHARELRDGRGRRQYLGGRRGTCARSRLPGRRRRLHRISKPFVEHLDALVQQLQHVARRCRPRSSRLARMPASSIPALPPVRPPPTIWRAGPSSRLRSLEETAAALEQITTTVRDLTGGREASVLVERTRSGAEKSGVAQRRLGYERDCQIVR